MSTPVKHFEPSSWKLQLMIEAAMGKCDASIPPLCECGSGDRVVRGDEVCARCLADVRRMVAQVEATQRRRLYGC